MAANEVVVAAVALVVSLIDLLAAGSQLLGQVFAPAEGTRQCGRSVIGNWAKLTSWRWHSRDLRFETFFVSPEVVLGIHNPPSMLQMIGDRSAKLEPPQLGHTYTIDDPQMGPYVSLDRSVLARDGWPRLVREVQGHFLSTPYGQGVLRGSDPRSVPGLRLYKRPWDSMHPDISRPFALTRLHDIAIIARRMGLSWKSFDPDQGALRAEGGPHVLSSLDIRGLGLALAYQHLGHGQIKLCTKNDKQGNTKQLVHDLSKQPPHLRHFLPRLLMYTRSADMFMFGISPGDVDLGFPDVLWDLTLGLNKTGRCEQAFDKAYIEWTLRYVANEYMHLTAPMIRETGVGVAILPMRLYSNSMLTLDAGRQSFAGVLERRLKVKPDAYLGSILQDISALQGPLSHDDTESFRNLTDKAHDCHHITSAYFRGLEHKSPGFSWHLIRAYLSVSPGFRDSAEATRPEEIRGPGLKSAKKWRSEQMNLMFDHIPYYVEFMKNEGFVIPDLVEAAWITMIFRGLCWGICHEADRQTGDGYEVLPAKYYGSQMPIYLI